MPLENNSSGKAVAWGRQANMAGSTFGGGAQLVREHRDIDQGAIQRAWGDLRELSTHWWRFRIPAAALTALFAVWGALLPSDATAGERIGFAIGGTLGGALVLGGLALVGLLLAAPIRQRNELRAAIGNHEQSRADGADDIVNRFSAWVRATRAALPEPPHHHGPLVYFNRDAQEQRHVELAAAQQRYRETKDDVERTARREYHEQFREPLLKIIGNRHPQIADSPQSVNDLEEIKRIVVQRVATGPQTQSSEEARARVLQRAIGLLLNELAAAKSVIEVALERETYWSEEDAPKTDEWQKVGADLTEHGLIEAHAACSAAFARIASLNQDALNTWRAMEAHYDYDPPPGTAPTIKGNETAFSTVIDTIAAAEAALVEARP